MFGDLLSVETVSFVYDLLYVEYTNIESKQTRLTKLSTSLGMSFLQTHFIFVLGIYSSFVYTLNIDIQVGLVSNEDVVDIVVGISVTGCYGQCIKFGTQCSGTYCHAYTYCVRMVLSGCTQEA